MSSDQTLVDLYYVHREKDDHLIAIIEIDEYGKVTTAVDKEASKDRGDWEMIAAVISKITGHDQNECYESVFGE